MGKKLGEMTPAERAAAISRAASAFQTELNATERELIVERLEYLRGEIRAERISLGEIIELQSLAGYIEPGDVELLEWAGVPEQENQS
jgi:hypothetical protein